MSKADEIGDEPPDKASPRPKGRKPDLVCIGAQKAGTSWLNEILKQHPGVWAPPFKEQHFFNSKFIEECRRWTPWHVRKSVRQAKERYLDSALLRDDSYLRYLDQLLEPPILNGQWYKFVYSKAPRDKLCLDITPEYCCLPDEGVKFVAGFLPKAKFVYMIRDPLERVLSQLRMNVSRKKVRLETFSDWAEAAANEVLLSRGDYATYVPRWDKAFGEDRLLYLAYGDIAKAPLAVLGAVESHAGLSPFTLYERLTQRIHSSPNIDVPEEIVATLRGLVSPQVEFLQKRFGENFLLRTRSP